MLNAAGDKSFVDDLVASGYCKCESSLCCYEALRFIPCFYDLFFFVFQNNSNKRDRASPWLHVCRTSVFDIWQKPTSNLAKTDIDSFRRRNFCQIRILGFSSLADCGRLRRLRVLGFSNLADLVAGIRIRVQGLGFGSE